MKLLFQKWTIVTTNKMSTHSSNSSASSDSSGSTPVGSTPIDMTWIKFGEHILTISGTGLTYGKRTIRSTARYVKVTTAIAHDPDTFQYDSDESEDPEYCDAQDMLRKYRYANPRDMSSLLMIRIRYTELYREEQLDLIKMIRSSDDLSEEREILAAIRKLFNSSTLTN